MSVTITAGDVNKLRQITGAGMMDCKKALGETGGDFEAAIDYLRKKGQKVSEKRADRETNEGVVIAVINNVEQLLVLAAKPISLLKIKRISILLNQFLMWLWPIKLNQKKL